MDQQEHQQEEEEQAGVVLVRSSWKIVCQSALQGACHDESVSVLTTSVIIHLFRDPQCSGVS
jgi:hypothetical protein